MVQLLRDSRDPGVRQRAVWLLGNHDMKRLGAVPALEAVLAETDEQYILVRYEAAVRLAVHLGEESSTKTIDVLVAYLNDHGGQVYKGSRVRVSRYGAEAKTGDSEVKQLGSDDPRWMPAYALGLIGRKADRPDVIRGLEEVAKADDAKVREKAREALASIRKKD